VAQTVAGRLGKSLLELGGNNYYCDSDADIKRLLLVLFFWR
jgi:hypothetical protein